MSPPAAKIKMSRDENSPDKIVQLPTDYLFNNFFQFNNFFSSMNIFLDLLSFV